VDAILTAVFQASPQLGGLTGLVALVVLLIRREAQTTDRHGTELDRMARIHDAERAELLEENTRIRKQRDEAETRLRELWQQPPPPRHRLDGGG
jgi:hypothetical protein